eukprot:ANDGO_04224.mRNA.1 Putative oligosaccharyltransferase complex subunit CG9662
MSTTLPSTYDPLRLVHRQLWKFLGGRTPSLRLRYNSLLSIPPAVIFLGVFLSYYGILAGLVYDKIVEPPFMGQERDPHTGQMKVATVMAGRINSQYVVEGLSASFFICIGALGFVLIDIAAAPDRSKSVFSFLVVAGIACIVIGYHVIMAFLYKKVPNYLQFYQ